jgi:hypothetical protein
MTPPHPTTNLPFFSRPDRRRWHSPISRAHRLPGSILPTAEATQDRLPTPWSACSVQCGGQDRSWGATVAIRRTLATLISSCIRQLDQEKARPDRRKRRRSNWMWLPFVRLEGGFRGRSAKRLKTFALHWMRTWWSCSNWQPIRSCLRCRWADSARPMPAKPPRLQ